MNESVRNTLAGVPTFVMLAKTITGDADSEVTCTVVDSSSRNVAIYLITNTDDDASFVQEIDICTTVWCNNNLSPVYKARQNRTYFNVLQQLA